MDSMIRDLYAKMVLGGEAGEAIVREREAEVNSLLEGLEKGLGQEEYEKYRDCALSVAAAAEERGFVQGMRYGMRLFAEFMLEEFAKC